MELENVLAYIWGIGLYTAGTLGIIWLNKVIWIAIFG